MSDTETILVVDADESTRASLLAVLGCEGRQVACVASAADAMRACDALQGADVALVEIDQPDESGWSLVRQLRYVCPETELILTTVEPSLESAVAGIQLGAFDYLTKPFTDLEGLKQRVEEALWKRKLRKQQGELYKDLVDTMERYELAARGVNDGLWDWDRGQDQIFLSDRWKEMLGYSPSEIGSDPSEWLRRIHPEDLDRVTTQLADHFDRKTPQFHSEFRVLHKDGSHRWVLSRASCVYDTDGKVSRVVGSQSDITDRKTAEDQILHDAFHDRLTGLANAVLFKDRLNRSMALAKRSAERNWAVFTLGVDGFRLVNESIGPDAGDLVLEQVARRLSQRFLPGDTIARLGGDEFAILVETQDAPREAAEALRRIRDTFEHPFVVSQQEVFVTASIGVVLAGPEHDRAAEVLRNANIAMQRAKSTQRGGHAVFESVMHAEALDRLDIDSALRRAIQRSEFRLLYQPIISLKSGAILGFEALVRWLHPSRGTLPPMAFIPLAEKNGLITEIGGWVLAEACRQGAVWRRELSLPPSLTMNVNVSERQLVQTTFVSQLEGCLAQHRMDHDGLKLEITESAIISDFDRAAGILGQVKALGVELAMDDFGTGYSALSYLHRLPFDTVKIDRSFVRDIGSNDRIAALLEGTISLAHRLGLSVVAEGIETHEQLNRIRELGCERGQGFLFAKPLRAADAVALLQTKPVW